MENDNVADKLYNLLGVKFNNTDIKTLDSTGKETTDMEEIEMFSFDFLVDSRNYGPVVILLSAESKLEVYYGDNTSKSLDRNAKKKWENLIEHLSTFARSNRLGFSLKHTTDLKYDLSNITDITESYRNIFEGYYGTRKTSYSPQGKAKIIIKHSKAIGEDDKRFRNISQIFIENADGERFKLPFKKLAGARAMARHVTEGGNPYDLFGVHISEMVNDINTLGGFVRRSKMYEGNDDAMGMVETGRTHYNSLRKGLKQIAGVRGYNTYKEGWEPSEITEMETDTTTIRGMFMDKKVNQRTEDALPLLARLQQMAEASNPRIELEETSKAEIQIKIGGLRHQYQQEMIAQNNKSSAVRSYAAADRIKQQIDALDRQLLQTTEVAEERELNEAPLQRYQGFAIEVRPYKKKFAAFGRDRSGKKMKPLAGKTEQDAIDMVKVQVDQFIAAQERVTGKANVNLNAAFTSGHLRSEENQIWAKLIPGPKLVVAGSDTLEYEEIQPGHLRKERFTKTGNRKKMSSETGTDLLGFGISPGTASASQAIANGRYEILDPVRDANGDKVYDLDIDSIATSTSDKVVLPFPALTVATARGIGEAGIEWPEEVKGNEFPGDTHPDQPDDEYDDDDIPTPMVEVGDSLRPTEKQTYVKIKDFNLSALKGYARRIGMTPDMIDHDADVDFMIDEIMGFLYDDDWERNLVTTGVFNEGYDEQRDESIIEFLRANKHRGAFDTLTLTRVAKEAGHSISAFKLAEVLAKLEKEGRVSGVGKTVGLGSGNFSYSNWTVPDEMNEVNEFEKWADSVVEHEITEGTWAVPATPEDLAALTAFLSEPQPMGIDGMNVTNALYDVIGNDELFDTIANNSKDNADMDARVYVIGWIENAIKNKLEFTNPAVVGNLKKALASVQNVQQEGRSNDLDADNETQLNASINKHVDAYAKTKNTNETAKQPFWFKDRSPKERKKAEAKLASDAKKDADVFGSDDKDDDYNDTDVNETKEAVNETLDLDELIQRTKRLLRK